MAKFLKYDPTMDELSGKTKKLLSEAVASTQAFVDVSPKLSDTKFKTRGAHAKSYAYVKGIFKPNMELVRELELSDYFNINQEVLIRFSNANNVIVEEKKNFPAYGMSLKFGNNICYPLVNFPLFPTDDVDSFLQLFIDLNEARIAQAKNGWGAIKQLPSLMLSGLKAFYHINPLNLGNLIFEGAKMDKDFLMNYAYHGIGCYRLGDYVGKIHTEKLSFAFENDDKEKTQFQNLERILRQDEIQFNIYVQMGVDKDQTPVNMLTKEWRREVSPYQTLGVMTIPMQQPTENDEVLEGISFNPFQNPDLLQPVGEIQQTRKPVYEISYKTRKDSI